MRVDTELKFACKSKKSSDCMIRGTQRLVSVEYLFGRQRYSDLIKVKTRDFFGETSPQTFATRELTNSYYHPCYFIGRFNWPRDHYVTANNCLRIIACSCALRCELVLLRIILLVHSWVTCSVHVWNSTTAARFPELTESELDRLIEQKTAITPRKQPRLL